MKNFWAVGNWKMNFTKNEVKNFFENFKPNAPKLKIAFAPQAVHLPIAIEKYPQYSFGAQNCSEHLDGAYTGELSAKAIADMGAAFTLVGHSERRQYFKESSELCAKKIAQALEHGLVALYCVGENLQERESSVTLKVIAEQLSQGLQKNFNPQKLVIAYEPVWAIGTGKSATSAQAQEVHAFIKAELQKIFPNQEIPVLYGGSVNTKNIEELAAQPAIDGVLVGGASLKPADFQEICTKLINNKIKI